MPIYEYRCPECGHEFERIMKFNATPPACPECGVAEVEKKVSQTSFQLKGTGWYVTDYKAKPNAPTSPAKTESKGDGGSSDAAASSASSSDSGGDGGSSSSTSGGDGGASSSSSSSSTPSSTSSSVA